MVESRQAVLDVLSFVSDVLPHLEIPPPKGAAPAEIERRRRLFEEVMRLRERMPPLGFDAADLIRQLWNIPTGRFSEAIWIEDHRADRTVTQAGRE